MPPFRPLEERFWEKVQPDGDCLIWTGAKLPTGYGTFKLSRRDGPNRYRYAHRVAWELRHGPIPEGMEIHHTCERRACVNVEHLELTTRQGQADAHDWVGARASIRARTHCPSGHPYDEANTGYTPQGWRYCRTCSRAHSRRRRERVKAARERAACSS